MAKISLDRLSHYLNAPEVDMTRRGSSQPYEITLRDATITWPTGEVVDTSPAVSAEAPHKFALSDMNVIIPQGELTLISGPLGSGKTLFVRKPIKLHFAVQANPESFRQLLGLLGEATILKGEVSAPRSSPTAIPLPEDPNQIEFETEKWLDPTMTAYSPQTSYIKHGSIRDNILHGLPLWPERYAAVLRQCALLADLDLLEHGDLTQVGEQGITLVSLPQVETQESSGVLIFAGISEWRTAGEVRRRLDFVKAGLLIRRHAGYPSRAACILGRKRSIWTTS